MESTVKNLHKHNRAYQYIFGPVPSRRLGMSLGVDLVPYKTCTLDCVYCESGPTTYLTTKQDNYVPMDRIKAELDDLLSQAPKLDFITFSGSGEPTLHKGINEIIRFIKSRYAQYKIAILTNGSLLFETHVKNRILDADVVKVSLDTVSEDIFLQMNRPCEGLKLSRIIDGIIDFRKEFKNQFWVEIFLIPGMNDKKAELLKIKSILDELNPDRIQLNTLDRPGTETWVTAMDKSAMEYIASFLYNAEIISHIHSAQNDIETDGNLSQRMLSTIRRRPCTLEDLSRSLGIQVDEARRHLDAFIQNGEIKKKEMSRGMFYMIK